MYNVRLALGQDTTPATQEPIINVWNALNELCLTKLSQEQCTGLIGTQPVYFPPTCKRGIPWWVYAVIGFVAGKHI
jgi:hypothetical protein